MLTIETTCITTRNDGINNVIMINPARGRHPGERGAFDYDDDLLKGLDTWWGGARLTLA